MTQRSFRNVGKIEPFCPTWGELRDSFTPEGASYDIHVGDIVKVQYQKYGTINEAKVMKIVADKETGVVREVDLVVQGDGTMWQPKHDREWRTVTPDKLRRIPKNRQEEEEDMKVAAFKGELPTRARTGRVRKPNPFDEHFAAGGSHEVTLDKKDDVAAVKRQLRSAASYANSGVRIFDTEDGKLIFVVTEKRARKSTTEQPGN